MKRRSYAPNERKAEELCRHLVVVLRDEETCQRCGAPSSRSQIHWAHVKNRGAKSLVCAPWASLALCAGCHFWFDAHKGSLARPGEGMEWWMKAFPMRAVALRAWEHERRHPKVDYGLLCVFLQAEINRFGAPAGAEP